MNQFARITTTLKGFEQASTKSEFEGWVEPGKYLIKEVRKDYPNVNTDYVSIEIPSFGDGDTWICTRWKDRNYAFIEKGKTRKADALDFGTDALSIDEAALTGLLPEFYDFTYDFDRARYPFPIEGFNAPMAPPATNNCCTFVEAIVAKAWENATELEWDKESHRQMMIMSRDDYFSPITCLVNRHIAESVPDDDQSPHPWTVIQGWRKQWTSGHTFIIVDHHEETDRVMTLESNSAYKLNGVGFRMMGNVKDIVKPPAKWWENEDLWTWERIKSVYRYRQQCILKIKNREWV